MTIPLSLQVQVLDKIQECLVKVVGKVQAEQIDIGLSFRVDMLAVAAKAYFHERIIEINTKLFLANKKVFLEEIIPHEGAHILQHLLYPEAKSFHGKEWKKIMKQLGVIPNTFHNLDVSEVESTYFRYSCRCQIHSLSSTLHKRSQAGEGVECIKCEDRLVYFPRGDCYSNI